MAQSSGSFFADQRRNKGFKLAQSPFFYLSQQKKNACKELLKRIVFWGNIKRLKVIHVYFVQNLLLNIYHAQKVREHRSGRNEIESSQLTDTDELNKD